MQSETNKINSEIETEKKNLNKSEYIIAALLYRQSTIQKGFCKHIATNKLLETFYANRFGAKKLPAK